MALKEMRRMPASAVVVNKGTLLLIQRTDGRWEFPKGRIEYGEEPKAAAKRELKEETGLTALKTRFLGYSNSTNKYKKQALFTIALVFLVTKFKGKVVIQKKEVRDYKWITINEALKLKPIHHNTLPVLIHFKNKGFTRLQE